MKLQAVLLVALAASALGEGMMVCYYGSWAVYRNGDGKFDIEQIDPFLCTHLVFGFAGLGSDNRIRVLDPYNELCDNYGKCGYDRFTGLKKVNPKLVTTLAVGGWNEGSVKYSQMAASKEGRRTFIRSALELLNAHGFDGLDMDWEYPNERGGVAADVANFVTLMEELKEALHADGKILTAAVSAGEGTVNAAYDVPAFAAAVDFIHVMSYDMHGAWDDFTHHHSILHAFPGDENIEGQENFNVDFGIQQWLKKGAPASKLVLGAPLYGRCWTLDDPSVHGMLAPASQPGRAGPYTYSAGFLGYNEMCEIGKSHPWRVVHDPRMSEPYAYSPSYSNTWCGYEDSNSIAIKAQYAREHGLAGGMVWSIETDDFLGQCGRTFNLIKTMREALTGGHYTTPPPPPPTTVDPDQPTLAPTTAHPDPPPTDACTAPGINADNDDCTHFYQCSYDGTSYSAVAMDCPPGSLFNPQSHICDFDYSVCALGGDVCPNDCPV